ncbi:MAG: metallophosphoesterase [Anaerohalosphaera sp.]|nr:metallophosphoesterase [Anaerohalosphaera sp.]
MKIISKIILRATFLVLMFSQCSLFAEQPDILAIPEVAREDVICFSLYTVNNNTLKMTAQLYPLKENEDNYIRLEVKKNGQWQQISKAPVIKDGWTSHFRVENWDSTRDRQYRLAHGKNAYYGGLIRKDPVNKEEIVVAAFTGNSIYLRDGGDIPKGDIVENMKRLKPDLLFFSGDQVYDHNNHYAYWLKFGRDFGDIIRNTPTITIPDDHDVGQGNFWGAGGKKSLSQAGDDGGYFKSAEYVKQVERAQTSHLPDPYDPTPIQQGIGVYYTSLNIGRISFAIIEDRKFKTGPKGIVSHLGPRSDHINYPDYDPQDLDIPEAELLGERQLEFLRHWATDWQGADMKSVLSQTIFCGGAHLFWDPTRRIYADFDSNGWPQTGRNKALAEMRKAFAVHIAGDQHLATIFHHGINEWEDAGYSFCVPSIANLYNRWWDPLTPGQNRLPSTPEYTGRHKDGFGNKITCFAAANPVKEPKSDDKLTTKSAGFGVIRFNKKLRKITFECWPRNVDITVPNAKQYPGWPKTIDQLDNYGRSPKAYLPELDFQSLTDSILQIIDEASGRTVYTLRINGNKFKPKVFHPGVYTIRYGNEGLTETITGVRSIDLESVETLKIK